MIKLKFFMSLQNWILTYQHAFLGHTGHFSRSLFYQTWNHKCKKILWIPTKTSFCDLKQEASQQRHYIASWQLTFPFCWCPSKPYTTVQLGAIRSPVVQVRPCTFKLPPIPEFDTYFRRKTLWGDDDVQTVIQHSVFLHWQHFSSKRI